MSEESEDAGSFLHLSPRDGTKDGLLVGNAGVNASVVHRLVLTNKKEKVSDDDDDTNEDSDEVTHINVKYTCLTNLQREYLMEEKSHS